MRIGRLLAVTAIAIGSGLLAAPASSETLASCAQRVIRDWYSGGRVDGQYPLRCYRAAIRALPSDVLQYSNADRDIARALAYARRGRSEPRNSPPPPRAPVERTPVERQPDKQPPAATDRQAPGPSVTAEPVEPRPVARPADRTIRLASGAAQPAVSSRLPYPIVALGMLAGVLLVSAAVGWLARRRT
jgi:hypothetical protein